MKGGEKWETKIDYANTDNWLAINDTGKDVDVIYFYPTTFTKASDDAPNVADIDDAGMRADAQRVLTLQASVFEEDCTLETLIENELKAYINSDPETKELPHFDGAKTIKIGVTGDLPPMDFVAANSKAAGFNIALLTEIANRAQVNFELVQIETGARAWALSSGKVDAVFWTKSTECTKCGATSAKSVEGTLATESYFTDCSASIKLKSDK